VRLKVAATLLAIIFPEISTYGRIRNLADWMSACQGASDSDSGQLVFDIGTASKHSSTHKGQRLSEHPRNHKRFGNAANSRRQRPEMEPTPQAKSVAHTSCACNQGRVQRPCKNRNPIFIRAKARSHMYYITADSALNLLVDDIKCKRRL
jgi:hypothetical protein